jgi:hypothetical protein
MSGRMFLLFTDYMDFSVPYSAYVLPGGAPKYPGCMTVTMTLLEQGEVTTDLTTQLFGIGWHTDMKTWW